ncbi:MAG: hypothetical protein ACHQQ3_01675 [Gemmatimonadales bacterium]
MTDIQQVLARLSGALVLGAFAMMPPAVAAQAPRRLELSDTTKNAPRAEAPRLPPAPHAAIDSEHPYGPISPLRPVAAPRSGEAVVRESFIRDQTALGILAYAPSFATAVTRDHVAWGATYLVVGTGTYFAAAELSRDLAINGPTSWFATQAAVRGGLSGWALAATSTRQRRAGAVFLGSLAGTVSAVALGRGMSDGEVAASVFGADLTALVGLAATHLASASASGGTRAGIAAATGLVGYPLGYWYASRASYHVSAGDVNTLWTSAAIGATAAVTFVANGHPPAPVVATTLAAGLLAGTFLGDRFLVRPYDHAPEDGQFVALGAVSGGLVGAGAGFLAGPPRQRVNARTAALSAVGAMGGVLLAEHWRAPHGDAGRKLSRLELDPVGVIGVVSGANGTHTLLHWTF